MAASAAVGALLAAAPTGQDGRQAPSQQQRDIAAVQPGCTPSDDSSLEGRQQSGDACPPPVVVAAVAAEQPKQQCCSHIPPHKHQPAAAVDGSAAIVRKVQEVEGKVQAIEQKWGPHSLKTGQAFFLLYHACRHPQAAPHFHIKGTEALKR
jgi:hypothetical protein